MSKKYKSITFICINLGCGGTEKVITNLAYHYSKKNIKTSIITLGSANLFDGFKISHKTEIIELKKLGSLIDLKKDSKYISTIFRNYIYWINGIYKYMKRNKNSIYISFLTIPTILTIIASLTIKRLHYGSERSDPARSDLSLFWKLLRLIFYRKLRGLIVQTEEIKNKCRYFISERRIKIIPNSINVNIKKTQSKITENEKLKVLFIGRLEYVKGIDIFLDAIIKISKENKRKLYDFEIIGYGSLSHLVQEKIRIHNLNGLLKYRKKSDTPLKHIKKSNIVMHPSRFEGMSNVVLEAMSCGKCVISSYQSSSGIITNDKDGILMKRLSSIEIINSLDKLSSNRLLINKIGLNAINTIKNKYSEKRIFKLWSKTLKLTNE